MFNAYPTQTHILYRTNTWQLSLPALVWLKCLFLLFYFSRETGYLLNFDPGCKPVILINSFWVINAHCVTFEALEGI